MCRGSGFSERTVSPLVCSKPRVAVTGATGFVGRALVPVLVASGFSVYCLGRSETENQLIRDSLVSYHRLADICDEGQLVNIFRQVDCVIHLAARAHVMGRQTQADLAEYDRVNHLGTKAVAKAALRAGVKRVIFVSSIKVNGEQTVDVPFTPFDTCKPIDEYGCSKLDGETALKTVLQHSKTEWVIVRPPLIYGPGAKGNLELLRKAINLGVPLPLSRIQNSRSILGVQNLSDFLICCVIHPDAVGQVFLVADSNKGISTPALIREIGAAMERVPRLWPLPVTFLHGICKFTGRSTLFDRLCGNLELDISHAMSRLGWQPPYSSGTQMKAAFSRATELL